MDVLSPRAVWIAAVAWSLAGAGISLLLTWRYESVLRSAVPLPIVWVLMGALWLVLFLPVLSTLRRRTS
jgi:predicted membrane channel-forming protein YqfA (hemolysin III family)